MPDTFFTEPPHWRWFIVLYFFIGGIAGGCFFLAALLQLFGRPGDRTIVRTGYYIAIIGVAISGILLVVDLGRPDRFWHMMIQNKTGRPLRGHWITMSTPPAMVRMDYSRLLLSITTASFWMACFRFSMAGNY